MFRGLIIGAILYSLVLSQPLLPTLLQLQTYEFTNTFGCGSFESGAMYLSKYSKISNTAELLLEGSCTQTPFVIATSAGNTDLNDLAFISSFGMIPLENISFQDAIALIPPYTLTLSPSQVVLQVNHSYLVVNSFRNLRSYWAFTVDDIIYNGSSRTVRLSYAVYLYEVFLDQIITPGFNNTARPHY